MTDEQQLRDLLTRAAELPDSIQPPVQRLLALGRRKRARRATASLIAVTACVVAAVAVPLAVLRPGAAPHASHPAAPAGAHGTGPSAAELARFRWSALPRSPLGPRPSPLLTWTGHELIELASPGPGSRNATEGAAFNPATGTWHRIADPPNTIGLANAVTAWTGQQLFVTNGLTPPTSWPAGLGAPAALYDPAANRWTSITMPVAMEAADGIAATWTGKDVVVAGTIGGHMLANDVLAAAYDPATRHWTMISPVLPDHHPARSVAMVATTSRLILWVLWDEVHSVRHKGGLTVTGHAGVDVLALGPDRTWHDVTGNWPQNQYVTAPAFTGSAILVSPDQIWCGLFCQPPYTSFPGAFADPATLRRTVIPPGPLGQANPDFAWTGRDILAVNLYFSGTFSAHGPRIRGDEMALYDPLTGHWLNLPHTPGHPSLAATPIWAGTQLLELTIDGALYSFRR